MRRTRGSWVVRGIFALLAVLAWQAGVLVPVLTHSAAFVLGVVAVYVVKWVQVRSS